MRVVLATEAIKPALTGIGRYAWELATRLPNITDIHSIRYLAHGRWKIPEEIAEVGSCKGNVGGSTNTGHKINSLYRLLARSRFIGESYDLLSPWLVKSRLNTNDTDLFHGPNYFVPKINVPCVVTIHDLSTIINPNWHPGHRVARINRIIFRSVDNARLVITDSHAIRSEVLSYFGLPEDRVVAVPLGVDAAFRPMAAEVLQVPLSRFGLQPGGYCLCVSTIEPRKNILRLLSAYRELPSQTRNHFPLVLVGDSGWNSQDIHKSITQGVLEGWLKYLGFVPQNLLPLLYAGCKLFVYPSLYEGFGLPVIEAMASGVPVLTSNRSSMPEVVGGAAKLVEPEDIESIRDGLIAAIENNWWRTRAVGAGLQRAIELSWEACIMKTVEAYNVALKIG